MNLKQFAGLALIPALSLGAVATLPNIAHAETSEQLIAQMPRVEDMNDGELLEELIQLTRRQRNILLELESSSNATVSSFAAEMMGGTMSMLERAEAAERNYFAGRMDSRR